MCKDRACVTVLRVRLIRDSLAALNCSAARRRFALIAPPVDKGRSKRICQASLVCPEFGGKLKVLSGFCVMLPVVSVSCLVFISKFNKNLKEGLKLEDALTATGMSRFRPIILTSITTIAGLAPLIFEKELQAQFLIPMAIAIAYGLILATLLTLVFLPAFLKIVNKIRYTKEWIFTGKKLNHEEREPAIKELEYEKL